MPGTDNSARPWSDRRKQIARMAGRCRRRLASGVLYASVLMVLGVAVGCNDMYPAPPVPADVSASKPGNSLVAGDEIRVVFAGAPELSTQQRIQANGKVSLPMIGEVAAAGRSLSSLQQSLTSLYQPRLQDSTVTVSLTGTDAGVYVSGAVMRPGKIMLYRPMTALEAVMEAGGFAPAANPKQVVVVRTQGGKSKNYTLNLYGSLHGVESTPFHVRPYDVIFVKERFW